MTSTTHVCSANCGPDCIGRKMQEPKAPITSPSFGAAPLSVECPECGSPARDQCVMLQAGRLRSPFPHLARVYSAKANDALVHLATLTAERDAEKARADKAYDIANRETAARHAADDRVAAATARADQLAAEVERLRTVLHEWGPRVALTDAATQRAEAAERWLRDVRDRLKPLGDGEDVVTAAARTVEELDATLQAQREAEVRAGELRAAMQRAADQMKRVLVWDSNVSGTWTILNDALAKGGGQ